jgi:hypothetical protein
MAETNIWMNISMMHGFEAFTNYAVSNTSEVKNIKTQRILKQTINAYGYKIVNLKQEGRSKIILVHRAVCALFKPVDGFMNLCVDHINGVTTDNDLNNLRWVTKLQNRLNSKVRYNSTTGHKNILVSDLNGKQYWRIEISISGQRSTKLFKRITIEVPLEVIQYRDQKLIELHGEFACLRN